MTESIDNPLDDLLARMPEIAKAVSAFPEGVQQSAFDALMAAASGTGEAARTQAAQAAQGDDDQSPPEKRGGTRRRKRRSAENAGKARRTGPRQTKVIKELDLRPKGKKSFTEFANEKNPTSQHDRHAVALYYLANLARISPVTVDHVFTTWREMGWKLPPDMATSLRLTANKKRFFDTSNSDDLRLLNPGVNRVEQDLPVQKKS